MAKAKAQGKMIANNKKAYHDYFILDTYEAGIALAGTEVECISAHTKREIFSIKILCV